MHYKIDYISKCILCLFLLFAILGFPAWGEAEDPAPSPAEPSKVFEPFHPFVREFYAFEFLSAHIVFGMSLRPDLKEELNAGQKEMEIGQVRQWLRPTALFGSIGSPLEKAIDVYFETPRLISITIQF